MEPLGLMHHPADVPFNESAHVGVPERMCHSGQDAGQAALMAEFRQRQQGISSSEDQYNSVEGFGPQVGMSGSLPMWPPLHHDPVFNVMLHDMARRGCVSGAPLMVPNMSMQGMMSNGGNTSAPLPLPMDSRAGLLPGTGLSATAGSSNGWCSVAAGFGETHGLKQEEGAVGTQLESRTEATPSASGHTDLLGAPVRCFVGVTPCASGPLHLLGAPVEASAGVGAGAGDEVCDEAGEQKGQETVPAISGYNMNDVKVVVTAGREALQAVLRFLNG